MTDPSNDEKAPERRIYVGAKGHRYVKAEELLGDPLVQRRLEQADHLASRLGLKGNPDSSSNDD